MNSVTLEKAKEVLGYNDFEDFDMEDGQQKVVRVASPIERLYMEKVYIVLLTIGLVVSNTTNHNQHKKLLDVMTLQQREIEMVSKENGQLREILKQQHGINCGSTELMQKSEVKSKI